MDKDKLDKLDKLMTEYFHKEKIKEDKLIEERRKIFEEKLRQRLIKEGLLK